MLRVLLSWLFDQSHFPAALLGLSADRLRADVGAGLNAKRRPETVEYGRNFEYFLCIMIEFLPWTYIYP